jgi:hypothetical protein
VIAGSNWTSLERADPAFRGPNLKLSIVGGAAALLLLALPGAALAEDLTFTLTNNSSYAVKSLFTSPADVDSWEEDVFADKYLPAGNYIEVTIGDGREQCVYDMKFVLEDDSEFIEPAVDLCELGEYTLTDAT